MAPLGPAGGNGNGAEGRSGAAGRGPRAAGVGRPREQPCLAATPPWRRCSRVPHSPPLPWPSCGHQGGSPQGRPARVAVCAPRCPWCECGLPKHKPLRASSVSGTSGPRTATSSCGSRRWAGHELAALSLGGYGVTGRGRSCGPREQTRCRRQRAAAASPARRGPPAFRAGSPRGLRQPRPPQLAVGVSGGLGGGASGFMRCAGLRGCHATQGVL